MLPEPIARQLEALRPALAVHSIRLAARPTGIVLRGRHTSVLVYDAPARRPAVLVKIARLEHAEPLLTEQHALERLEELSGSGLRVPQLLAAVHTGERFVLAQSVVPGVSLFRLLRSRLAGRRRLVTAELHRAAAWLRTFQLATADHAAALDIAAGIDALVEGLDRAGDLTPARRRALDRLVARATRSGEPRVPTVWAHGDFWPGNLMRDGETLGVIDWAHLSTGASPSTDLGFLVFTSAHATPWRGRSWSSAEQAFDRAFHEAGWFRDAAVAVAAGHLAAFGIDADAFDLLLLLDLDRQATRGAMDTVGPHADWHRLVLRMLDRV